MKRYDSDDVAAMYDATAPYKFDEWCKTDEAQAEIDDLKTKADRLVVLAVKHCPHNHRDWEEIRKYWDGTA